MRFANGLFLLLLMVAAAVPVRADVHALRRELDRSYSAWREAMATKNFSGWQQTTAAHRQMSIRNLIVSQQQPFPAALFAVPMKPPETAPLRFVEVQQNGETASLVYFGKVDLGIADAAEIPENLLFLRFVREASGWKFDTTSLINLEPQPDVRAVLKGGGKPGLLSDPDLLPTGVVPPVAKPCPKPDRIGVLQVASFGYETRAVVNGFDVASVTDNAEEHIIIGGLRDGVNPLVLDLKEVPLPPGAPADAERVVRVSALVLTGEEKRPAIEVFEWKPTAQPGAGTQNLVIHVSKITLR
ncbi:hypothetical protein FEM03_17510 [Phragmitibacter flavus]|uniref:DUF4440 domain-containing protein n=1 Tax=Phragmitibacter flavus TaxID=2576071 RepID=A0A5R8KAV6_9BACT|nr:hypothetical protein [Phragmitibacter flavus]TLD69440.1 hypothetical protein FEM03_17510 [Phragmitibacter flavus]